MSKKVYLWISLYLCLGLVHQIFYRYVGQYWGVAVPATTWIYGQALFCWLWARVLRHGRNRTKNPDLAMWFWLRGIVAVIGQICFFYSIQNLPLVWVTLSSYMGVIITGLGAMLLLERRMVWSRIFSLAFVILGMYARDPIALPMHAYVAPMLASICFSLSSLLLKKLTESCDTLSILEELFQKMSLGLGAWLLYSDPSALILYGQTDVLIASIGLATLSLAIHSTMTIGYRQADLSQVVVIKSIKVPISAFLDWAIYKHDLGITDVLASCSILTALWIQEKSPDIQIALKKRALSKSHTMGPK